jgi:hypothetical protein
MQADVKLYSEFLNNALADDEHVGMELPIGVDGVCIRSRCRVCYDSLPECTRMTLPPPLVGIELCRLIANGIAPCKLLNTLVPNSVPDGDLMFIVTDDTDRRENLVSALCVRVIACLISV